MKPQVFPRGEGGCGVAVVAEHCGARFIATHQNLAGFSGGERIVVLADYAHFKAVQRTSHAGKVGIVMRQIHAHVSFGGAITRSHRNTMARLKRRKIRRRGTDAPANAKARVGTIGSVGGFQ